MRRRPLILGFLLMAAAVGSAIALHERPRPMARPDIQFADLETALAPETAHGWSVAIPPKRPGPYRLLPGGPVLGSSPADGLTCQIKDATGTVVEEIKLVGAADCDQGVVYLETVDGQQTMAGLKRPR